MNPYLRDKKLVLKALHHLRETREFVPVDLALNDSKKVWLLLQYLHADIIGNSQVMSSIKREASTEFPGSLLVHWIALMAGADSSGMQASMEVLKSLWERPWVELESDWSWLWNIEFHLWQRFDRSGIDGSARVLSSLQQAHKLAQSNGHVDRVCACCIYLISEFHQRSDQKQKQHWLDELNKYCKSYESSYFLAYFHYEQGVNLDIFGKHEEVLESFNQSRKFCEQTSNSVLLNLVAHYEIQVLARLGRFKECELDLDWMRRDLFLAERGTESFPGAHIPIEALEICLKQYDVTGAWSVMNQGNLKFPVCCPTRVRNQLLKVEVIHPGRDHLFYDPQRYANQNLPALPQFYEVEFQIHELMLALKQGAWVNASAQEYHRLKKWTLSQPFPYLHYLINKLEFFRCFIAGDRSSLELMLLNLVAICEKQSYSSELAYLLHFWDSLAGAKITRPLKSSLRLKLSELKEELGQKFFSNAQLSWPFNQVVKSDLGLQFEFDLSKSSIVVAGHLLIPLPLGTPVAIMARILVNNANKIVTYSALTRSIWKVSYSKVYHGQKLQALVYDLRSRLKAHNISSDHIVNVQSRGYILRSLRKSAQSDQKSERKAHFDSLLKKDALITSKDLQNKFGYSQRQAERDLKRLQDEGIVTAFGGKKNRHYKVN